VVIFFAILRYSPHKTEFDNLGPLVPARYVVNLLFEEIFLVQSLGQCCKKHSTNISSYFSLICCIYCIMISCIFTYFSAKSASYTLFLNLEPNNPEASVITIVLCYDVNNVCWLQLNKKIFELYLVQSQETLFRVS
jgi:hypothetical protein